MIPVPIIVGGILVNGLYGASQCIKIDEKTMKKNAKAFTNAALAEEKVRKATELLENSMMRLANRKKGILIGYMERFQKAYKEIIEIRFESSDEIGKIESFDHYALMVERVSHRFINIHTTQLSNSEALVGFLVFGLSGMMKKTSEMELSAASSRARHSQVVLEQANTVYITLDGIKTKLDMMSGVLSNLGLLFNHSLTHVEEIIQKNGNRRENYTKEEKQALGTCINLAQVLYGILDTPLLDKDGEITKAAVTAIETGERYIEKMDQMVI